MIWISPGSSTGHDRYSQEERYPSHLKLNYCEFHTPCTAHGSFLFISTPQAKKQTVRKLYRHTWAAHKRQMDF